MGKSNAHVSGANLIPAVDLTHLLRREVGAVGIEAFRKAAHGAAHHAVHVRLLDVIAHDERDDVVEHPEVRIRLVGAGHGVAQQPSNERECDDRRRDENGNQPGA